MNVPLVSRRSLMDSIKIKHGALRDVRISIFSIVRNESYFLKAFFNHYRSLGVNQFIMLDDNSIDGTLDFLKSQPDCLTIGSDFSFGQRINYRELEDSAPRQRRAGIVLKSLIGRKYLSGKFAIHADADEFLLLPNAVRDLPALFDELEALNTNCVPASLIEFYPENLSRLDGSRQVNSLEDLLSCSPYYDHIPLLGSHRGSYPRKIHRSATWRLCKKHKINFAPPYLSWLPPWITEMLPFRCAQSSVLTTPVIKWSENAYMKGSHKASVPPSHDLFLAMMHFKFTGDFSRKVKQATIEKAHRGGSSMYFAYSRLYVKLKKSGGSFLSPNSRKFSDASELEDIGLIKWNV